jgi:hypothetical protein
MEASPSLKARVAGACWLMTILIGFFLMSRGDWSGVAANVVATVFYAVAANIIATAFYAVATVLVYQLLAPVNRTISLVAAVFSLIGCVLWAYRPFAIAPQPVSPMVFFGLHLLLVGYLILKSAFLPRIVGALLVLGGLGHMTFLFTSLTNALYPFNFIAGFLGEGSLTLWLLVMGVNVSVWEARVRESRRGGV